MYMYKVGRYRVYFVMQLVGLYLAIEITGTTITCKQHYFFNWYDVILLL